MSLLNSLTTGVSGLRNHQTMMDVIGNNIANVNSLGYKGSRVSFSDTFSEMVRYGTNPTANGSGGTNTFQIGLGMKVNSIDRNWNQGTFENTGISTDLGLQGSGMFVMENNGQRSYSRAGAFKFDANGTLVSSQNGAKVMGKMANSAYVLPAGNNLENITIDSNLKLPAVATTNIKWGGNLSSSSTLTRSEKCVESGNLSTSLTTTAPDNAKAITSTIYDESGNSYKFTTTYTKTADNAFDVTYAMKDSSGADVTLTPSAAVPVTFDAATGKMLTINGTAIDPLSPIPTVNITGANGINFDLDPSAVTQTSNSSLLSSSVNANRVPTVVSGTLKVFDSEGNSHSLTVKYTKTAEAVSATDTTSATDATWSWTASVPSGNGTLSNNSGTITFNSDGSIATPKDFPSISYSPNGAAAQSIQLDFGGIAQTISNSSISPLSQNGIAAGNLLNLNVDQNGKVIGVFSNGESKDLAQIMVANFVNKDGLVSTGDNMFVQSANSGIPTIADPGSDSGTTIQSGSLEQSNVDLSTEFTQMIVAQRGFQANAKVVTTADSLLQEIVNLVR